MTYQQHKLNQFIPTYVPHSDYLPSNKVVDGRQIQVQPLLRQYEVERSKGRIISQKPAEFDPRRYVSVRTYEDVKVNQPITEEELKRRLSQGVGQFK